MIEITPKMIKAGASVLCAMELAFADEKYYAEEVFEAMMEAHDAEKKPIEGQANFKAVGQNKALSQARGQQATDAEEA